MTPTEFEQQNSNFIHPEGLEESQVATIPAYSADLQGGSLDGVRVVVVAWKPSQEEIQAIASGSPIFLTCLGGLPGHCLTTSFQEAISLA